jgi:flavin reductase (DIM6/NTAB) family NADH-FMN oxidoreductase RutF
MDPKVRKKVLRMLPHGLQIVTVRDGEEFHGYTSSWVTQASFKPPLIVLGVRADSRSRQMMDREGVLCVHFLDRSQQDVAQSFFKTAEHGDKLAGMAYRIGEQTGCPVIEDALAHAECKIVHIWDGGDHVVVVAEVLDAELHREGEPLTLADTPWQYGG